MPEAGDKHTWPGPVPGSEPHTLGLLLLPPPRREVGKEDSGGWHPPPHALLWLWAAASLAEPSLADWAGSGLQPALPVVPVSFCLHPDPNHNLQHRDSSVPRGCKPDRGERRQQGDKIEGGFSYSIFQSPQTYSGAKRIIYLVNKRNRKRKLVFSHFNGHRRKLDGDPTRENGSEPS